jgi:putative tryptophan/tyrosine transport system substrate-binding protein
LTHGSDNITIEVLCANLNFDCASWRSFRGVAFADEDRNVSRPGIREEVIASPTGEGEIQMAVIGFLNSASSEGLTSQLQAFHKGLKLGGYVDGQNVTIEYRWAESDDSRLAHFAADLASRDLVLIAATGGAQTAKAVRKATFKIPVLFVAGGPIGQKAIVPTLKGRNATGVNLEQTPMVVQRLQLLNELNPRPAQITSLVYKNLGGKIEAEILSKAARQSKQKLQVLEAKNVDELRAFGAMFKHANNGLLVQADPFFLRSAL